jgi:hypothetical protein
MVIDALLPTQSVLFTTATVGLSAGVGQLCDLVIELYRVERKKRNAILIISEYFLLGRHEEMTMEVDFISIANKTKTSS